MDEPQRVKISKFLSLVLRHKPDEIGLVLAPGGWVAVDELLSAMSAHGRKLAAAELREVVETSDKKRFAFDETGERIRANQGHSVGVELEFEERTPPDILFHGTAERFRDAIFAEGLLKMSRHHVHLSVDEETARNVGERHGRPLILRVDAAAMFEMGHRFYIAANGVWLVDAVPREFLSELR